MKSNKDRTKKIIAGVLAFVIIGVLLVMANGLVGNPISKTLVNRAAEKHVDKNYSELDLEIEKPFYNFKDGNYIVRARSDTSIDTYFEISFTLTGKLYYDNYEDAVLSKWNTRMRLEDEYRKLTAVVFEDGFPYQASIDYGELLDKSEDFSYLELDKIYDIKEMGRNEGHLVLNLETEDQDLDTMVKALFDTKKMFDAKEVPFHSIDLTLQKPKEENVKYEEGLMIKDFLYNDIYLEGLEKRVEKSIEDTKKYWEEEDKEREKEFEEFEKEQKDKVKK